MILNFDIGCEECGQHHSLGALTPGKKAGVIHLMGCWEGLRTLPKISGIDSCPLRSRN